MELEGNMKGTSEDLGVEMNKVHCTPISNFQGMGERVFFFIILFVSFHFCKMLWNQCLTCYLDTNPEPQSLKEWDLSKAKSQKDSVGGNKGFPAAIRDLQSHRELIALLPLSMGSISHRQEARPTHNYLHLLVSKFQCRFVIPKPSRKAVCRAFHCQLSAGLLNKCTMHSRAEAAGKGTATRPPGLGLM